VTRSAGVSLSWQPKGGTTLKEVVPIDREAGLAAYAGAESPLAARKRRK
jgi:hypothetical protein